MKSKNRFFFSQAIVIAFSAAVAGPLNAASSTWTSLTSGGNWMDVANWNNGAGPVADGAGSQANFSTIDLPAGAFIVNLTTPRTIGELVFGDTETELTPGTWNLAGTSTLTLAGTTPTISTSVNTTIGTVIDGSAGFTKTGAANLVLTANNLITGPITVAAGQVTSKNNGAFGPIANTLNLSNGTTYRIERTPSNASSFVGNPISVAPASSVTITSDNAANGYYAVVSSDAASTINIGAIGATTQVSFLSGGNVQQFGGVLGTVKIADFTSLRFSSTSGLNNGGTGATFEVGTGGDITTRNGGTVNLGALTGAGTITGSGGATGTAIFSIGAKGIDSTYNGIIQNGNTSTNRIAAVTKVGAAKLTLTGENTYTGATNVNAGILEIGNGGTTGQLGATNVNVADGASLVLNTSGTKTVSGVISGLGSLIKRGSGSYLLSNANTITTTPVIEEGTLLINADSGLGAAANNITFANGAGTLSANAPGIVTPRAITIGAGATGGLAATTAADSLQVDGMINGSGGLVISGDGVVRLTADNTYSGTTTVNSGILSAANITGSATSTGAVTVNGGVLAGAGTIAGPVTAVSGTGVKPGSISPTTSGVGTLTTGALSLAGGTTLFTEFANASTFDKLVVNGNLATPGASAGNPILVDLRVENSIAKWTTLGTYNLIQYSGTFAGTPNTLFKVSPASTQSGLTYTFSASGGFIRLAITGAAPSEWNVDGNGNWSVAANWLNGVPNSVGASAKFGSIITAPRIVTVNSPQTAGFLQFNSPISYTLGGTSPLTLSTSSGNAEIGVLLGTHTISAPLVLSKTVNLGFVSAAEGLTLSGNISGPGGITNDTPGSLILGGTNTFAGNVDFKAGSLTFGNGSLGNGSLFLSDTSLIWEAGNTQDISSKNIAIENGDVRLNTNGNNVLLANPIGGGGGGSLVKAGTGRLTLAGDPTYSGTTTIAEGILQLGNGGASGAIFGPIVNNATLAVNFQTGVDFDNVVSGTGDFVHAGSGTLILSGESTFQGTTTIAQPAATLQLANSLALQNSTLLYNSFGGSVDISQLGAVTLGGLAGQKDLDLTDSFAAGIALTAGGNNATTTYEGGLTGSGSLTKIGTGTLLLAGNNSYSGTTTVTGGVLEVALGSTLGGLSVNVGGTGNLLVSGGNLSTGTGTFSPNSGGLLVTDGTATFSGAVTANGSNGSNASALIKVTGGSLQMASLNLGRTFQILTAQPAAAGADQNLYITGGNVNITGNLDMGVNTAGNSTVSTRIDGGQLTVDGTITVGINNTGRWSVVDVNGGVLNSTNAVTGLVLGGPNAGNSELLVRAGIANVERIQFGQGAVGGSGVVFVTGGELYVGSGGIQLGTTGGYAAKIELAGGLLGANAGWTSSQPVSLTGNATIQAANAIGTAADIELSGPVTGLGALTKVGGGTLTLSGTPSYEGNTTVGEGTLKLTTPALADGSTVLVESGATLRLDFTGNDQVLSFFVNGAEMPAGSYGRIGSPVAGVTQTAAITGDGILAVGAGTASGYASWAANNGLTAVNNGTTQDPDDDGISNVLEFVLGGNPLASSGEVIPKLTVNATSFVYSFTRDDSSEAEVALNFLWGAGPATMPNSVAIDAASSPADANGVTVTVAEGTPAESADVITVTLPRSNAVGGKLFGRLQAVK